MRAKISTKKTDEGYVMIAEMPNGGIEYPQECKPHKTKTSVYRDAEAMYSCGTWDYNSDDHTFEID